MAVWYRDRGRLGEALTCAQDGNDPEELADTYAALGMHDAELDVRFRLLDDDPATLFSLAAALRDRGDDARSLFSEIVVRCLPPDDGGLPDDDLIPLALRVLAEDRDDFFSHVKETR